MVAADGKQILEMSILEWLKRVYFRKKMSKMKS